MTVRFAKRRWLGGAIARKGLASIVALAAGLGPAAEAVADNAVLRFGIDAADLGTGDPHRAASRNDRAVADMVFNGLLRYEPGNAPVIEPDLAEAIPHPRIEDDGRQVWTFRLRQGVMCHAGPTTEPYELTADDVVYSLDRAADPEVSAYAGEYEGIRAEKVDEYTIDIILDRPLSSILFFPKVADYAGGFIVCSRAVEAMGDEGFGAHPVGTGPFTFGTHDEGVVQLQAHDAYFRNRPLLDTVEVRYLPNFEDRDRGLRAGELDVVFGSERSDWFDAIKDHADIQLDVFGVGQVVTIHFNTTKPPLDDARVRRAIAYALDREVFRSRFAEGVVENVFSPVPEQFLPGGLSQAEAAQSGLDYPKDLERARALLAEAGYPDGFALKLVTSERGHYRTNYESLRDQLAAVGIDVEVEVVAHQEMHERIRADENPIVIYVAWRPNADVFLSRFFHSDSTVVTGKSADTNFSHYDQIDPLIEMARGAREPKDQVRFWKQAQIKILQDMVAYPLHYISLVYARNKLVDYGHALEATFALYPQFTERTRIIGR